MDISTKVEIIELFYSSGQSYTQTIRTYCTKHKCHVTPFSCSTVKRLVDKFKRTGSVVDAPRSGRPSLQEERKDVIVQAMNDLQSNSAWGAASSSEVSRVTSIPQRSVARALRNFLAMYPYKLQRTQALIEEDRGRRVKLADWIIENQNLLNDILWTDESYFCLDGSVNRHNCVIWGTTKPTQTFSSSMGSPKVCIWMGISSTYVLTPFFFDATINGENYTNMLEDHVFPQLRAKRK